MLKAFLLLLPIFFISSCESDTNSSSPSRDTQVAEACNRDLMYQNFPHEQADMICREINKTARERRRLYDACVAGDSMACQQYQFATEQLNRRLQGNIQLYQQWENNRN